MLPVFPITKASWADGARNVCRQQDSRGEAALVMLEQIPGDIPYGTT
jgi:hypothetical protein